MSCNNLEILRESIASNLGGMEKKYNILRKTSDFLL